MSRNGKRKKAAVLSGAILAALLLLQGSSFASTHVNNSLAAATTSSIDRQDSFAAATISRPDKVVSELTTFSRAFPKGPVVRHAQPNDGVIVLVTRTCGDADNWRSVAADNDILPPNFLVLVGQALTIDCISQTPPDPLPEPAPVPQSAAPAAPQVVVASSGWQNPLPGICFAVGNANGFHTGARPSHDGVDMGAGHGTPILAAAAGTVSVNWQAGGAGNYTTIDHGNGVYTVYMHQSSFARTGGWVNAGEVIGYVGNTGNSFGPHLHLEVHTGGLWSGKVNPVNWFWDHGASIAC